MLVRIAISLFILIPGLNATAGPSTNPQLPKHLVVANSASWVPYSFLDLQGQPRGILIDLWRLFAKKNNIEVEFELVDWADSIELVRTGAADVHGGLIETKARREDLHFFPTEILRVRTLLFINEDIKKRDLAELSNIPVGVVASSYEENFIRANFSNITLKPYPNSRLMVESAVSGELKIFVTDHPTGYYHLISLHNLDRFDTGPTLYTRPIQVATKRGDSAVLNRIAASAKQIARDEFEPIYQRWFIPKQPMSPWLIPTALSAVALILLTAIGAHSVSLRRTIRIRTEALQTSVRQLEAANQELDRLARTDHLTGLPNRFAFFELVPQEIARDKRYSRPLSLAIFDLDHFKVVNDKYGHQAGDAALRHVAKAVKAQLRPSDVFARIGGEEFAIMLPETESREAKRLLERLLKNLAAKPFQHEDSDISVSFSAGVTEYTDTITTLDELIMHADAALYQSKAMGRSRVSVHVVDGRAAG